MFFTIDGASGYLFGKPTRWVSYAIKPHSLRSWKILSKVALFTLIAGSTVWFCFILLGAANLEKGGLTTDRDLLNFVAALLIWCFTSIGYSVVVVSLKGVYDHIVITIEAIKGHKNPKYRQYLVMEDEYAYTVLFPTARYKDLEPGNVKPGYVPQIFAVILAQEAIIKAERELRSTEVGFPAIARKYESKIAIIKAIGNIYSESYLWMTRPDIDSELDGLLAALSVQMRVVAGDELTRLGTETKFAQTIDDISKSVIEKR